MMSFRPIDSDDNPYGVAAGTQRLGPGEEFVLDLSHFCIETTARKAREKLVALCLADHGREQVAPRTIELLGDFLTQTDFRALRASDPDLGGHGPCRVLIYRKRDGGVGWKKLVD